MGQLKKKSLAPGYSGSQPLETLNYEYNIRGWMLGMNRDYIKGANFSNYFGFDLGYDKVHYGPFSHEYAAEQYNGNITGTTWKSKGDQVIRNYDFTYDAVNRLTSATFSDWCRS